MWKSSVAGLTIHSAAPQFAIGIVEIDDAGAHISVSKGGEPRMYSYKDISTLTRIAIGALWVHMVLNALFGTSKFYVYIVAPHSEALRVSLGLLAIAYLFILFVTLVIVGRWIYRASANAHAISGDLTISPGWAVGWYFVPFANLVKPLQAMKETWLASRYGSHWESEISSPLLGWWWGLWIVSNILGNASLRLSSSSPELGAGIDLFDGLLQMPLTLLLITIMKQIWEVQKMTVYHEAFA
jgi:hypothetical protein